MRLSAMIGAVCALTLAAGPAGWAGNRVAVVPFGRVLGSAPIGDPNRHLSGRGALDPAATAELLAALSSIPYITLVDQALIMGRLGTAQPGSGPSAQDLRSLGAALGADWLVTGDFTYTTERSYEEEFDITPGGRERTIRIPMVIVSTSMSVNVTDVATGASHSHLATARETISGRGSTGNRNQEAVIRSTFKKTAQELAPAISSHIDFTGTILSVEQGEGRNPRTLLVVSLGRGTGIQTGMEFNVTRSAGIVLDPATGQERPLPERRVGKCKVTEIGSETSYAELKSGEAAAGDKLELAPKQARFHTGMGHLGRDSHRHGSSCRPRASAASSRLRGLNCPA